MTELMMYVRLIKAAIFLLLCCGGPALGDEPPLLRAGAAAIDITPEKFPVSMTGSFQDRQATAAHDRLHARCLVLDDGATCVAIVVCDSCLITRDIYDKAKRIASADTGIDVDRILASATHTHTAPTAVPLAQCHPDPNYVRFLTERIALSIARAHERLQPARIGWAVGREPREVNNRRWFVKPEAIPPDPFGRKEDKVRMNPPRGSDVLWTPAGPTDPDVSILSVQSAQGHPIALLANYSLHYVGGIPQGQLSADYFGEFARQIQRRLDADDAFVGIMSNGTSGDVNNYNFREPRPRAAPFQRVREVAGRIADVVHASYTTLTHRDRARLIMMERVIDLGVRRPGAAEIESAKALLAQAKDPKRLNTNEMYAQESLRLAKAAATVQVKLQVLQIGDLAIVAEPCEAFAEIGLEIKRRSPSKPTFVIGLANGYNGYLPTPRQHAVGGYETWRSGWSYLEVQASTKIMNNLVDMLERVAVMGSGELRVEG